MKIDYSIKPCSKYLLYLDVPYRQGLNHLMLGLGGKDLGLSVNERIKHIAMGILKFIPILGNVIAFVDTFWNRKTIIQLKLTSTDPFKRGEEHGKALKNRIKEVYEPILSEKRYDFTLQDRAARFEKQIPENLKEEMKGLAKGSGYSYKDVLLIHTFLDAKPGQFGCTSMAVKEIDEKCQRIAAANHSVLSNSTESESRRQAFLNKLIPKNGSIRGVLTAAGKEETIQSMVFDSVKGEISLSSEGSNAASGKFKVFKADSLFNSHQFKPSDSNHRSRLFRNLDWPWYFLGQETVVLTRPHANGNSTVSISWPGYIGTLSGMNNSGLALTLNQRNSEVNFNGIPNPLLFTDILDSCKNVEEASQVIDKGSNGSSMNVIIVDKTSAKSYELQGASGPIIKKSILTYPPKCVGEIH